MGGKKNKHNHKQRQQQKQQPTYIAKPNKRTDEELQEEVLMAQGLIQISDEMIEQNALDMVYLIDSEWYYDWQEYTGYSDILSGLDPSQSKYFNKNKPKEMNKNIIEKKKADRFIKFPLQMEKFQYLNVVTERGMVNSEVKKVSKEVWEYLHAIYGGTEIQRKCYKNTQQKKAFYDIEMCQPEIMFINDQEIEYLRGLDDNSYKKKSIGHLINMKHIQVAKNWNIQTLKQVLLQFYKCEHQGLDEVDIKIWQVSSFLTDDQLKDGLIESIKNSTDVINFKGTELTNNEELKVKQIKSFMKSSYILIVEAKSYDKGKFLLQQSKNCYVPQKNKKDEYEGYCEDCFSIKSLSQRCLCKKVHYCSKECMYDDKSFHSKTCELAYDSEDDDAIEGMEFSLKEKEIQVGLENIGNTCYMNSALQCLLASVEYSSYFTENKYKNVLHFEEDIKEVRLTVKFAKLMKKMAILEQGDEIYPYSFKSQLEKLAYQFKGTKQQDSQELLNYTIDLLNSQLKNEYNLEEKKEEENGEQEIQEERKTQETDQEIKPEKESENPVENQDIYEIQSANEQFQQLKKPYCQAIQDSFLGMFKSVITCPECANQSINFETFTVVSVPIAYKPVSNNLQIYYIPYDIDQNIQILNMELQEALTLESVCEQVARRVQGVDAKYLLPSIVTGENISQYYFQDKLKSKMKEVCKELNSSKNLAFYEIQKPVSEFTENDRFVELSFCTESKAFQNYSQQLIFAAPRVITIDESQPHVEIYRKIYSILKNYYPEQLEKIEALIDYADMKQKEKQQKLEEAVKKKPKSQWDSEEEVDPITSDEEDVQEQIHDLFHMLKESILLIKQQKIHIFFKNQYNYF